MFFFYLGSTGSPELLEQQHQQADGPGDEDDPPDQQGGDGPQTSGYICSCNCFRVILLLT